MAKELVRKNIRMSPEIAQWYEDKANALGVSQSGLMTIALDAYIKQEKTIEGMNNIQNFINELEKIKDQNTEK